MLNLYGELRTLIAALGAQEVPHALCGGLAMAIHGKVRATIDIDLLVPPEHIERAKNVCRSCGFTIEARPMHLANGKVTMERLTKAEPGSTDILSVDLLHVTSATRSAWDSREHIFWESLDLATVSREGLIALKRLRGSGQDQDDIAWLEESE